MDLKKKKIEERIEKHNFSVKKWKISVLNEMCETTTKNI